MTSSIQRHVLGMVAFVLLIAAIVLLTHFEVNVGRMAGTICLRVGLTLGALWLAFPQILAIKSKYPPRLLLAILFGSLIVIAYPRSFPLLLVLIAVIGVVEALGRFLKPSAERGGRPRPGRKR